MQTLHSGLSDPAIVIALAPVTHNAFATCHALWFPGGLVVKPPANSGDAGGVGSIPGLGRSPGGGNGTPLLEEIPGAEEPGGL